MSVGEKEIGDIERERERVNEETYGFSWLFMALYYE